MASSSEVMHCYDRLAATVARMLELAQAGSWDGLPELENQCFLIVERLKAIEPFEVLSASQRDEVARRRTAIHEQREQVVGLVKPQLERLVQQINQLHQQQGLNKAYGVAT